MQSMTSWRVAWLAWALSMALPCAAAAQKATARQDAAGNPQVPPAATVAGPPVVDMDTLLVTGTQPGPGMWQVRKGGHVLWILGTQSPLPERMEWQSADVREMLAQADAIVRPPGLSVNSDIGLFGKLFLLPSMFKARKNPDGKTLAEVVPPAQYARWQALKARWIGKDRGVEQWRPVFAAQALYAAAIRKSGMTAENPVSPLIDAALKRKPAPEVLDSRARFEVKNPRAALKEFNAIALDDGDCFARTLDRIDGDLGTMKQRANAWAEGDIDALRALPYPNQYAACLRALSGSTVARRLGAGDMDGSLRAAWLASAEKALATHAVSFGTLPMGMLIQPGPDNYLDRLRAKGYEVVDP